MPLIQSSKAKSEMAQRAALIGGREGWPTPDWNKGLKRFNTYTPFFGSHSTSKDWPISGVVDGRAYTTFRVSTEFSRMILGGRRITTYYHTAIVFPDVCNGMPLFDLISKKANWEEIQNTDKLWTPTGDPQFDLEMTLAANAADRPWVLGFMTPQIKQAARKALRANASARIRFGAQKSHLACWINGKDARDGNLPPLLGALAELADAFGAAVSAQPGPMPPQQQQPQQQQQQAPYPQQQAHLAVQQPAPVVAQHPAQQYGPPQQYAPPQPQYPYPPQPAPGYPAQVAQPMPGYPVRVARPAPGYPAQFAQPMPGYPTQPAPGYPAQPGQPAQPAYPAPGYPAQSAQPTYPAPGYPAQSAQPTYPAPGYPGQPAQPAQPTPGYPSPQLMPQPIPQQLPTGYPPQPPQGPYAPPPPPGYPPQYQQYPQYQQPQQPQQPQPPPQPPADPGRQ